MKKLFFYLVIRLTTRRAETAVKIYERIYHPENDKQIINIHNTHISESKTETQSVATVQNPNSKKQEIMDSLKYLRSKQVKTKQDKESIYSLEMVLKNIK